MSQVPAIMIPITASSQVFPSNMPLSLMMQAGAPGFIPLMYNVGQVESNTAGDQHKPGPSSAASHKFELPNCPAVDSCMTVRESVKEEESKKQVKRAAGIRPTSGGGSRDTSVKGEPGSALESNASAGEPSKTRAPGERGGQKQQLKQIGEELCSSSQSLYSFLPSSDENDITDFLQASSSKPDDSGEDDKVKYKIF